MEKKTKVNYRIFYALILILLSLNQNFSQEANAKIKKRIPISYTEEEIKSFPEILEKPNKRIRHIIEKCSFAYECDFEIQPNPEDIFRRNELYIHEHYVFYDRTEDEYIERGMALRTTYLEGFTRVMTFSFDNKDFRLHHSTILQRQKQNEQYPQENYEDLRDKTYILEPRLISLYPSKIKILDYIELNDKPRYYFLILARPVGMENAGIVYDIFLSMVVIKIKKPKISYCKKISESKEIWRRAFYGLREKNIDGNRIILFNQNDRYSNGPENLSSFHLVRVGKVKKK